ncbi:MAG: DNA-3-methyladenine glycosylase 2 family protein [Hyphomicrobiales bacterium]|nr:DNA-3-methyladenine glycosylase 2 family protein [Hyphomicrobiales bacterium]
MQRPDNQEAGLDQGSADTVPVYNRSRAHFRLDLTVWALRRRLINEVDRWDGVAYRRTLHLAPAPVEVVAEQTGAAEAPRLRVDLIGAASGNEDRLIRPALRRLLGLDADLAPFYAMAAPHPRLNRLAAQFRGMRPPRFPTVFEAVVNGIACRQLSLEAGLILLNRLTDAYGQAPPPPPHAAKAFPRPGDLADVGLDSLRVLGFSRSKGLAIVTLASALTRNEVDLEALESLDDDAVLAKLDELRGVGRWTAEYVLLRGYGRLNVFPGDDIGARKKLQRWLRPGRPLDSARTLKILRPWQPYGGLVYLHLLLKSLSEKGMIRDEENAL